MQCLFGQDKKKTEDLSPNLEFARIYILKPRPLRKQSIKKVKGTFSSCIRRTGKLFLSCKGAGGEKDAYN